MKYREFDFKIKMINLNIKNAFVEMRGFVYFQKSRYRIFNQEEQT